MNAQWRDGTVVGQPAVNVGIAVATDDALDRPGRPRRRRGSSCAQVAERRIDLVARARERKLRPDDVEGGTFTISNLGMFGVDAFQAIVQRTAGGDPRGRPHPRHESSPSDGAPAVRPTLTLTLSFDHRVVDGAVGARFLDTLASLVEEPAGLVT